MRLQVKRAYEPPASADSRRVGRRTTILLSGSREPKLNNATALIEVPPR